MGHDGSKPIVVAGAAGAGVEGFGGGGGYFHPLTLKPSGNVEGGAGVLSFRRNTYGLGIPPYALLHKCSAQEWNEERASIAGFADKLFACEGHIYKDCSPAFCMSRQGIIDINKGSSIFSFRRRTKFSKMAAHFEYHHIPAQLSTIQKFHVKGVLCFFDNLVVVHLVKLASQFGLLDLKVNKFKGVFGQQMMEFPNESLLGQISPDKRLVVIKIPCHDDALDGERSGAAGGPLGFGAREFLVYDLDSKTLIQRIKLSSTSSRFCFDPRFASSRLAVTNFHGDGDSTLSLVSRTIPATSSASFPTMGLNSRFSASCRASSFSSSSLSSLSSASSHQSSTTDWHEITTTSRCHPAGMNFQDHLQELQFTKNGSLIIGTLADNTCHCRSSKSSRQVKPIDVNYFIAHGDSGEILHVIRTQRFTCVIHLCPVNYTPILSHCSSRLAVATTYGGASSVSGGALTTFVCVYHLPTFPSLQNMCRTIILQHLTPGQVALLPLPNKLLDFLAYKPEFDYKHH